MSLKDFQSNSRYSVQDLLSFFLNFTGGIGVFVAIFLFVLLLYTGDSLRGISSFLSFCSGLISFSFMPTPKPLKFVASAIVLFIAFTV